MDTTIYPTPISASYFSIDFDNGEFTRAAAEARIAFEYCLLSHSHARRTRRTLLSQYVATFLSSPLSSSAPSFFSSQYTKWNRSEVKIPLSIPFPSSPHLLLSPFPLHNMCIPAAGSFVRSVDDGITQFASYADSNAGMDGVEVFCGLYFRLDQLHFM